jgi:hypothetical protein
MLLVNMEKIMNKKLVKLLFMIFGCLLMVAVVVDGHSRALDQSEVTQFETRCGWLSKSDAREYVAV